MLVHNSNHNADLMSIFTKLTETWNNLPLTLGLRSIESRNAFNSLNPTLKHIILNWLMIIDILLSSSSSYLFIYKVTSYHRKKLQLPLGLSPKHQNMQFL